MNARLCGQVAGLLIADEFFPVLHVDIGHINANKDYPVFIAVGIVIKVFKVDLKTGISGEKQAYLYAFILIKLLHPTHLNHLKIIKHNRSLLCLDNQRPG
jgi:hypothetical protein